MQKKYLKISLVLLITIIFNNSTICQTNDEALVDRFKNFLDELNSNISMLSDREYASNDVTSQRYWLDNHFFDNADLYDECTGRLIKYKDFIYIKLPYLQQEFEYVEYRFELIRVEVSNTANLKLIIRVANSIVFSAKCTMLFSIIDDNDFKVRSISLSSNSAPIEKDNLPKNFCEQAPKKNVLSLPISTTVTGIIALGSSLYFENQSNNFYTDYQNNISNTTLSEDLYKKANNSHHAKLILRYSGTALTAAGLVWVVSKIVFVKKRTHLSEISFKPNSDGVTLIYSF